MSPNRPCPVSTIFAREVHPGHEAQYEEWLSGISRASAEFPGNQGTTVLRPAEGRDQYIAITHFESPDAMDQWLVSEERRAWLDRLESITVDHEEVLSLAGMERWFTLPHRGATPPPPRYKTAALVLLGLYPVVMVLNAILSPLLAGWPGPLRVFVSLVPSVSLMVWVVLPWLTKLFAGWLHPRRPVAPITTARGAERSLEADRIGTEHPA